MIKRFFIEKLYSNLFFWGAVSAIYAFVLYMPAAVGYPLYKTSEIKVASIFRFYDAAMLYLIPVASLLLFGVLYALNAIFRALKKAYPNSFIANEKELISDSYMFFRFHDEVISQITGVGTILLLTSAMYLLDTKLIGHNVLVPLTGSISSYLYVSAVMYAAAFIWFFVLNTLSPYKHSPEN